MIQPFYADGLRFSCTRCSLCCRGEPGYVFLSASDIRALLAALSLDFASFFGNYCRLVDTGQGRALSLREKPGYDCIFWEERGCAVYRHRPQQCRSYPFWPSIMTSCETWRAEARSCPGIGAGELRTREYIEECLYERRAARTVVLSYDVDPERMDEDTILGSAGFGADAPDAVEGQE